MLDLLARLVAQQGRFVDDAADRLLGYIGNPGDIVDCRFAGSHDSSLPLTRYSREHKERDAAIKSDSGQCEREPGTKVMIISAASNVR